MEWIKKIVFVFIFSGLAATSMGAVVNSTPNQGIFESLQGQVRVKPQREHKIKKARKDMTVFEGDKVMTGPQSSATLRFFDGSTLDISANTELIISKLQKPSTQDKILQFRLLLGKLLAEVTKLNTAESSFEVDAGGVVCGVRGTKFSMECDGKSTPEVSLEVFQGTVYVVDAQGEKYMFHQGSLAHFLNGLETHLLPQTKFPSHLTALNDLNNQFKSQIGINQNTTIGVTRGIRVTIKPYIGN